VRIRVGLRRCGFRAVALLRLGRRALQPLRLLPRGVPNRIVHRSRALDGARARCATFALATMFRMPVDESLELVLLEQRHAPMLFALIEENRAHLRQWLPWVDANRSMADSLGWIQMTLDQFAKGMSLNVGLFTRGMLAGICGYHTIDWANRRTSIGYWLAASQQGKGLMARAVRALTTHAFASLQLNRLEIRAALDNRRSRGVAERVGYKLEGQCRQAEWLHDRFVDHAIYGMLAREWSG
jgi:ribosomal-protein-serine acetyltransferase